MDDIDLLLGKLYLLRATVAQVLSDDAAQLFNVPDRAATRYAREKSLLQGLARGIVRLRSEEDRWVNEAKQTDPIPSQIHELSPNLRVELTFKGGALWQRKAAPSWQYFLGEGEPRSIHGHVWIFLEAKSQSWLGHVDQTLRALGFFRTSERRIVVLQDWHALYWKKFRRGYSLGINTGYATESERGARFLQGLTVGDSGLGDVFSVLSAIWDAKWVTALR